MIRTLTTLALTAALATPTAAHASSDYTHTIGRWPAHVATVCAESSAPANWKVARAVRKWNRRDVGQPRLTLRNHCKVERVTVRQVYRKVTWGGMASVKRNPDWTLRHVTVQLNRWKVTTKPSHRQRYRRYISTHEFGHVLGLYHPPAGVNSIMAPGYRYETRAAAPTRVDWRDLARIYR